MIQAVLCCDSRCKQVVWEFICYDFFHWRNRPSRPAVTWWYTRYIHFRL